MQNTHFICIKALAFRISINLRYLILFYCQFSCLSGNLLNEDFKEQQWERKTPPNIKVINFRAGILCWFQASICFEFFFCPFLVMWLWTRSFTRCAIRSSDWRRWALHGSDSVTAVPAMEWSFSTRVLSEGSDPQCGVSKWWGGSSVSVSSRPGNLEAVKSQEGRCSY